MISNMICFSLRSNVNLIFHSHEYYSRAVSVFADLKQQYGAGNCHLLQINSKRAGQTASGETDETTNMPDPWRLYVKQSSLSTSAASQQQQQAGTLPKRESAMSDSLSNLTELIDQELNLNSNHFLSLARDFLLLMYVCSFHFASIGFT